MSKVQLNIEKLDDRDPKAKILVYGESGVGKTVFASTAPRPILWLDSEAGTNSISDRSGIDVVRITGLEDYRTALRFLQENPDTYQTVVLDSFTETQAALLKEIMRYVVKVDASRDEFSPLFGEWNRLVGIMREVARGFRDLPMHVIITALAREDKDDLTGKMKVRPRLSPALADELPGFMDVVGFLYTTTPKQGEVGDAATDSDEKESTIIRSMLLQPTSKYAAKVRAPAGTNPPDFIREPTFDELAKILQIGGTK